MGLSLFTIAAKVARHIWTISMNYNDSLSNYIEKFLPSISVDPGCSGRKIQLR